MRTPIRRRTASALIAVASVAALALSSCSSSGGSSVKAVPTDAAIVTAAKSAGFDFSGISGLSTTTVKVGQLLALTGPGAFFGDVMSKGSKLAAAQIRQAGGPNIVFDVADNKSGSPDASVTGGRRLVTQSNVALLQSSFGASTLALIPLINQYKELTFNPAGATSDQLSKSTYLWMARATATDSYPAFATYAHQLYPDAKTAAVIVGNDSSSLAATTPIKTKWQALGGSVLGQEVVTEGASNFGPQIAKLKSLKPDVIFMVLFGNDYSTALKEMRQVGLTTPVFGSDWSAQGHTATGSADDGYVFQEDAFDPSAPSAYVKMFVTGYKAKYKTDPEPYGASFYENTWQIAELVARVVKSGKKPTSQNLLAALTSDPKMPASLTCDAVSWDTKTHAELGKPEAMSVIKNGAPQRVGLVYGADLKLGAALPCQG